MFESRKVKILRMKLEKKNHKATPSFPQTFLLTIHWKTCSNSCHCLFKLDFLIFVRKRIILQLSTAEWNVLNKTACLKQREECPYPALGDCSQGNTAQVRGPARDYSKLQCTEIQKPPDVCLGKRCARVFNCCLDQTKASIINLAITPPPHG